VNAYSSADLLAIVGLGFVVVAMFRAGGRKLFVVVSTGTGLALLVGAALIGHAA
jgi:hypothetical protein